MIIKFPLMLALGAVAIGATGCESVDNRMDRDPYYEPAPVRRDYSRGPTYHREPDGRRHWE